jgi:hypothetical protein
VGAVRVAEQLEVLVLLHQLVQQRLHVLVVAVVVAGAVGQQQVTLQRVAMGGQVIFLQAALLYMDHLFLIR